MFNISIKSMGVEGFKKQMLAYGYEYKRTGAFTSEGFVWVDYEIEPDRLAFDNKIAQEVTRIAKDCNNILRPKDKE